MKVKCRQKDKYKEAEHTTLIENRILKKEFDHQNVQVHYESYVKTVGNTSV